MEYLNNILGSQSQTQSVEEAIPTLCNRLQHATMVSDRRSAVLGLKSFSRQYRETVVEHGLRPLISTLKKDNSNLVIFKSILETFLILFIRGETHEDLTRGWISQQSRLQNGKYPSPLLMDDITLDQLSLWIADALLQDSEILSLLIEGLNENDYHSRLYTIQLLESLVSSRGNRVKEALLNIPTSISTLCNLLNDSHEPVRNEAILLLMAVANNNFNIQKLVAFENTFETLFNIIDEEGGIRGSILVQDCLTLITNLLQYNASNQKFFLETQCVPRLARLLGEPIDDEEQHNDNGVNGSTNGSIAMVWTEQRLQNMITVLEICRLLVSEDNELVVQNQNNLYQSGIHYILLKLIFLPTTENEIRLVALLAAADAISGNPRIQHEISKIDVPYVDPSLPYHIQIYDRPISVPMALLNWCLLINSVHQFNIRVGASYCLKAYFKDNKETKESFLNDQITDYKDDQSSIVNGNTHPTPIANVFKTVMDYDVELKLNPYKVWFAAITLLYTFEDESENKELARAVKTGDEEAGEEIMSAIQAISGLLITTLNETDQRIAVGYLMLLTVWLYADFKAVDDFSSDESNVKSILAFLSNNSSDENSLVHGMAAILLGVAYEFSTKDSPIPRKDLHLLMVKSLGLDNYSLKVKQFSSNPAFKNFEDIPNYEIIQDESGLPDVYFDSAYVNMIKENFFRIKRALFHDPDNEPKGKISFEHFEEMDMKVSELRKELNEEKVKAQENETTMKKELSKLEKTKTELQDNLETYEKNLNALKTIHESVNNKYKLTSQDLASIKTSKEKFETSSIKLRKDLDNALKQIESKEASNKQLESQLSTTEQAKKKLEDGVNGMTKDLFHMKKQNTESDRQIKEFKSRNEKISKEFEITKMRITELESLLKQVNKAKDEVSSRSKEELDKKNLELTKSNQEIDKYLKQIESFKEQLKSKSLLESKNKELDGTIITLTSDLKSNESKLEESTNQIDSLKNEVGKLNSKLKSTREKLISSESQNDDQLSKIRDELSTKVSEVKKLEAEIIAFKDELTSSKTESSKLNSEIEQLKEKLKVYDSTVLKNKKLEEKGVELTEEIKKRETASTVANKEIEGLKEQLKSHQEKDQQIKEQLLSLGTMESDKKKLEKNLEEAKAKFEAIESTLESTKIKYEEQIKKLTEEIKSYRTKEEELVIRNKKLQDQIKSQTTDGNKTEELKNKIDNLNKDLESSKATTTELKSEVEKLNEQIKSYSSTESKNKEFEEKINKLSTELKSKDSKSKEYLKEIETLKDQVKLKVSLDSKNKELQSDLTKLKSEIKEKDLTVEKSKKELENLQTGNKTEDLANKIDNLSKDLETSKATTTELESEVEKLNEQIKSHSSTEAKNKEFEEKINNLSAQLKSKDSKSEEYLKEIETLKDQLKLNVSLDSKNKELQSEIAELKSEIKEKDLTVQKSKKEVENLQTELTSDKKNESRIADLEKKINILEDQLKDSKTSFDESEIQIKSLQEVIKTKELKEETNEGKIKQLETKFKATVSKSEHNDLLEIMLKLDDKKTKYEKKLKEMGVSIDEFESDSDEDDEDDEEDEDEDE
ncbi:USO1 [Candida jiufengensis]|uniref:USO1 n=1 Tax=Candida jiufengensis TaxID=497108 RepID=UPI002224CF3F|nr:USO1 [Candida jiufengensis]KAI5955318.1 USO1 [Candida jiufengensis]